MKTKKAILGLIPIATLSTLPIIAASCSNKKQPENETKKTGNQKGDADKLNDAKAAYTKALNDANSFNETLKQNVKYKEISKKLTSDIAAVTLKINDASTITDYNQAESSLKTVLAEAKEKAENLKSDSEKLNDAKEAYTNALNDAKSFNDSLIKNNKYKGISANLTAAITTVAQKISGAPTIKDYKQAESELKTALANAKEKIENLKSDLEKLNDAKASYTKVLDEAKKFNKSLNKNAEYKQISEKLTTDIATINSKINDGSTLAEYNQAEPELKAALEDAKAKRAALEVEIAKKQAELSEALKEPKKMYESSLEAANTVKQRLEISGIYKNIKEKLDAGIQEANQLLTKPTVETYKAAKEALDQAIQGAEKSEKDEFAKHKDKLTPVKIQLPDGSKYIVFQFRTSEATFREIAYKPLELKFEITNQKGEKRNETTNAEDFLSDSTTLYANFVEWVGDDELIIEIFTSYNSDEAGVHKGDYELQSITAKDDSTNLLSGKVKSIKIDS